MFAHEYQCERLVQMLSEKKQIRKDMRNKLRREELSWLVPPVPQMTAAEEEDINNL